MLPTRNVTTVLTEQDGEPIAEAIVEARLTRREVYQGTVVPDTQVFRADETGTAVLALWPNTLGKAGSRYRIVARHPLTGAYLYDVTVTVPDYDVALADLIDAPGQNAANVAWSVVEQARGYADEADTARLAAEAAEDSAEAWAQSPEDTTVIADPAQYSALHHAAKAEQAQTGAQTAETGAESARDAAAASETNAAASETAAAASETAAATSETNAAGSQTSAAASEAKAQQWAEEGEDTAVEPGAYSALHHAAKADASASAAATSETNAAASETAAATSETNAAASESAAATSETNAAGSESAAATSAADAATSETNAAGSASAASTSEANASASETAAATSETNAATSETNAQGHYTDFLGVYYGALASDPATDPNGNALNEGDFYYNTTNNEPRIYDGATWSVLGASTANLEEFALTEGQTTVSPTGGYTSGFVTVTLNGVALADADFDDSSGTDIVLADGAAEGDILRVLAFGTFDLANHYTKAESDDLYYPFTQAVGLRNRIINGGFDVWQRGESFTLGAAEYTSDRWFVSPSAAVTVSKQQASVDSVPQNVLRVVADTDDATVNCLQKLEQGWRLANSTVTFSFNARASKSLSYNAFQVYDETGATTLVAAQTINITTSWQRFSRTFSLGALTEGSIYRFYALATLSGSSVLTNDWVDIANVQLEAGPKATPFENRPVGLELALCKRYYETGTFDVRIYDGHSSDIFIHMGSTQFAATKRALPAFTFTTAASSDADSPSAAQETVDGFAFRFASRASSALTEISGTWAADSEL